MKKKILFTALLAFAAALASTSMQAQTATDTLTVSHYRLYGPTSVYMPFMSDSVNMKGEPFDKDRLLNPKYLSNRFTEKYSAVSSDADGFVHIQLPANQSNKVALTSLVFNIANDTFTKSNMVIESTHPHIAYFDGNRLEQGRDYFHKDSIRASLPLPLRLEPTTHQLVLQIINDPVVNTRQELKDLTVRVRLMTDEKSAQPTLSIDDNRKLDLDFMLSGESLARTSVSPSGKYTILSKYEMVDRQAHYTSVVYKGREVYAEISDVFGSARWMPKSDKLYYTRKTDKGTELILMDPDTFTREVLHPNIPEGNITVGPNESVLFIYNNEYGNTKSQLAERMIGRGDRESGYRDRAFLYMFDMKSGILRPLTFGYRSTYLRDISKDDNKILISTSHRIAERPFSAVDVLELDLQTMQADTIIKGNKYLSDISYTSKPGFYLIKGGPEVFGAIGSVLPAGTIGNSYEGDLYLYEKANGKVTPLTKYFDPSVASVKVLDDRFEVIFSADDRDYIHLYRCNLANGKITQIPTQEDVLRSFDISRNGNVLAYVGQSISNSDRFYITTGARTDAQPVYDLAAKKMKNLVIGEAKDWDFTMPDGDKVQGRYYLPPNFDPNKKYPMIVYYYGGTTPVSRFFEGSYSYHMYAAQGYVVYVPNPSGAIGYGQEYAARHVNAWGKRTADEIVAATKGFCDAHPFVMRDKVGCMGASYGGFMTQYLQTVTDFFAAAASHAGISSIASYWGEGYWGVGYSTVASADSYPWNNPDLYVKQSPLFNADKIKTPLLLLHGTSDTNVPEGESIQMYNALKLLGKEVELVEIPGQDHHILDPAKRVAWTNTIFAWFQRWLKDDPSWWNDLYPEVNH